MFPVKNLGRNIRKAFLEPRYAFSALIRRSRAFLRYLFDRNGKSSYPEAVTLFLTFKCNLRCHMCGQWGDKGCNKNFNPKKIAGEVPITKYMEVLDEIKSFSPSITLFGGEPLMYSEIESLITEVKKRDLHCCIITNGVLLKRYADVIVNTKVDELSVSIDGPKDLHDKIRNVKGAFETIMGGIKEINRIKKEKGTKLPIINIVCTMSNMNYKMIKKMINVAEDAGANTLNFHHLIFTDEEKLKKHNIKFKELFGVESSDWEGFLLPENKNIDTDYLSKEISEISTKRYSFLVNFYPNFSKPELKRYYTDPDFIASSYPNRCISPWIVAYIYPDGSILPCHSLGLITGNINDNKFMDIWNGEKFTDFRRKLKRNKHFGICSKCTEMYRY